MARKKATAAILPTADDSGLLGEVVSLLENARRMSARAVNAVMTATYWEIRRRIVEIEQRGEQRAGYGDELIQRLAAGWHAQSLRWAWSYGTDFPVIIAPLLTRDLIEKSFVSFDSDAEF